MAFSREQRRTNYGLGSLTAGGPPEGLEAAKRRAAERSRELLAKAGVDLGKLARFNERAHHDFARVFAEALRPSRRLEIVGPEEVPVTVLGGSTDAWTVLNISPGVNDADYQGSWSVTHKGDPEEEEKTFAAYIVPTGEEVWLHLATSEILPGNAWTYVKFGTYETQWVRLNDVSIDSVLKNRWFFEEVHYHFLD